jgi:hypothetical protein
MSFFISWLNPLMYFFVSFFSSFTFSAQTIPVLLFPLYVLYSSHILLFCHSLWSK